MYTYATVCSGVEGCSLALDGMGWKPVFFSEIEPFPCAVLKSRWPEVPNLGDMSKISYNKDEGVITNGKRTVQFHGRLDLLAGGTPCQDFSVAGKRAGGEEGSGTRSSLMWEWLRLARELQPRVLFWENVVGTFSSNGGRDFYELVRAIDALGYCVSWRVLDAQYTRVDKWPMAIPQRRRRVWLVGCLGTDVGEIAKILFEHQGLVGDTAPCRRTRQEAAGASQDGNQLYAPMVGEGCLNSWWDGRETSATLTTGGHHQFMPDKDRFDAVVGRKRVEGFFDNIRTGFPTTGDDVNHTVCTANRYQGVVECFENHPHDSRIKSTGDCCQTITQKCGTGGGNLPLVVTGMAQNSRDEVRVVGDGNVAGCLAAEPGMKQQTYLVSQGMTFDAHMGFPMVNECSQTLKNGTAPGTHNGVVVSRGVDGHD